MTCRLPESVNAAMMAAVFIALNLTGCGCTKCEAIDENARSCTQGDPLSEDWSVGCGVVYWQYYDDVRWVDAQWDEETGAPVYWYEYGSSADVYEWGTEVECDSWRNACEESY